MQLQHIPVGYRIFNIEMQIGRGGQIVRSAGTGATLSVYSARGTDV
jgi:large subunit ribosomal protein L2